MIRKASLLVLIAFVAAVLAGLAGLAVSSQGSSAAPATIHRHATVDTKVPARLAPFLADARLATAKYATNLARAKKDG